MISISQVGGLTNIKDGPAGMQFQTGIISRSPLHGLFVHNSKTRTGKVKISILTLDVHNKKQQPRMRK